MKWWRCKNPFFRKITYSRETKTLFIYNFGCNWACLICTYRIKDPCSEEGCERIPLEKILSIIKEYAENNRINQVKFLGGEPLINPDVPRIAKFARTLNLKVGIGHTNLSIMPPLEAESAVVSIKAINEELHKIYTGGFSNKQVLHNFEKCYQRGILLKTNTVFVPEFVDKDEIERIAEFVASVDERIPFHIIGYIPIPEFPWRRPTRDEILDVARIAKKYLQNVTWSLLTLKTIKYPSIRVL